MELTGRAKDLNIEFLTNKPVLTLEIDQKEAIKMGYDKLKQYDKLDIKISKHRRKRSINANNYAWQLMTKIAENQGITKEEVYRQHIKEIGVLRQVEIDEKAVDTLIYSWGLHGSGWIAERLDYGEHEGFVLINLYYGSSTYNTKQMSRLIDNIVQDCKALDIETMTPEEIEKLKAFWKSERE